MSINKAMACIAVIPAQAGIQVFDLLANESNQPYELDSLLRGNDGFVSLAFNSSCLRP
jgi:hypothetical protein